MSRWRRLIYFVRRVDGGGPIKIGCSSCPASRAKQLGFDHGEKFEILAIAAGGLETERVLHRRFANSRAIVPNRREGRKTVIPGSREWFAPTPELLGLIDDLNAGRVTLPIVDDRDEGIVRDYLFLPGATLESIGTEHGLTRERVRQILKEHNCPSNPQARRRYKAEQRAAA